jgi:hypothetical protein
MITKAHFYLLISIITLASSSLYAETKVASFMQCPQRVSAESKVTDQNLSLTNLCLGIPALDWNGCANLLLSLLTNGDSSAADLPQFVTVKKDRHPNAFLTSSNSILITSGLTSLINSGEQLAFILAHEIAHSIIDRCAKFGFNPSSHLECQRVINTPSHDHNLSELRADGIALNIMKGLSLASDPATGLLNEISKLQSDNNTAATNQLRVRITALNNRSQTYAISPLRSSAESLAKTSLY